TDSLIWLEGSLVSGLFNAYGLRSESDLRLRNGSVFKSEVNLNRAKIDGHVELTGARFDSKLDASNVQIGGYLLMNSDDQNKASFKEVVLAGAKVAGHINMAGASFDGVLHAGLLQVGGFLHMASMPRHMTNFENDVNLTGAKIAGQIN